MASSRRSSKRSSRSSSGGGLGRVNKAVEQQKKRAAARDRKWMRLEDGDEVIARLFPTEEFFKDGFVHRVPMELKGGKKVHVDVMCLDQDDKGVPCPGCKDELQRRYKFWTPVIVRDWEDEDSKKAEDTVMIWSGGITVGKRLNKMAERHDLSKRDIVVERSGSTKDDTEYSIEWEDDEDVPYSSADKKLLEKAPDITRYTRIPEYDDFYKPLDSDDDDDDDGGASARKKGNPFNKRKKSSDDDDDEPKRGTRRRSSSTRRSSSSKPSVRRRRG